MSSEADGGTLAGLIIGLGHRERQDDGVGPYIAEALHHRGLPAVVHEGEGTALLDLWERRPACIVIDALSGPGAPGGLHRFDDFDGTAFKAAAFLHSTHRLGLPEAIALGRHLDRLPGRLTVLGITGSAFGFGDKLSPGVAAAAEQLIEWMAGAEDVFVAEAFADFPDSLA